jgi:hypothetical protein
MQLYASLRGWSALLIIVFALAVSPCLPMQEALAQSGPTVEYVFVNINREWPSNDPEDGESWTTAFRFLQDGLDKADALLNHPTEPPDAVEIWVAQGVYLPAEDSSTPSCPTASPECPRDVSFMLRNNVAIYGGFGGWEQSIDERVNWLTQPSVLDGDLMQDDVFTFTVDPLELSFENYELLPVKWARHGVS